MRIDTTNIPGAYILWREPFTDERGSFARLFCKRELEAVGLNAGIAQVNLSTNDRKATLRGLHCQKDGAAEDKLVACVSGAVFDVCVDVRENSPTFGQWVGETLSAENGAALYVPKGCAHGYLSLADNSQVLYFCTQFYMPGAEAGYRYNDPAFNIRWPLPEPYVTSAKDSEWPHLTKFIQQATDG